jgi:hypothetical protein
LLILALAQAAPPEAEVLSRAEAAFAEGVQTDGPAARQAFARAGAGYEELRQRGAHNPALYRNQGNAYLLAGDLPRAILAYRRGLQLAPNDWVLRANLVYAREHVIPGAPGAFGRPPTDDWPPWLLRPTPGLAVILAGICYGLACASFTRWLMTRRSWLLAATGTAGLLAVLLSVHAVSTERGEGRPLVIVAAENVRLHKGNGRAYPSYPWPLPRGTEACFLFARGNWLQIELAGGEVGWVPRADVVCDEPP